MACENDSHYYASTFLILFIHLFFFFFFFLFFLSCFHFSNSIYSPFFSFSFFFSFFLYHKHHKTIRTQHELINKNAMEWETPCVVTEGICQLARDPARKLAVLHCCRELAAECCEQWIPHRRGRRRCHKSNHPCRSICCSQPAGTSSSAWPPEMLG